MPGSKPKYKIQLLDNQIAALHQLVNSCKAAQCQVLRARIVLAAHGHPDRSNQQIATQDGCAIWIERKWRHRWEETLSCSPLEDRPRLGAPN